ncbi:hypothetical protein NDU88_004661 [Pleurodeles waltl]|uniref:Uncharacterized protein n=1 Tax=Pleurodeles waltl TaxID=8319 RepID=A0AAV7TS00_PLEWA|nr:hypothetical protein NDU88_004661 [Pleurodeles waltl]
MSQSGDVPAVATKAVFELEKLEEYTVTQVKQFCKDLACPIRSSTRKEEPQKALRAWVAAKEARGHIEEMNKGKEVQINAGGVLDVPVLPVGRVSRAGSSVSSKSLTPEELQDRQAERVHQFELEKLKMEMEERRLAIEDKNMLLADELSLRELDQRSMWQQYLSAACKEGAHS